MPSEELKQAIALIRSGDLVGGRELLLEVLKTEPGNESAWLWLAQTFSSNRDRLVALEQCLKYNPKSQVALRALEALRAREPKVPQTEPAHPVSESPAPAPFEESLPRPPVQSAPPPFIMVDKETFETPEVPEPGEISLRDELFSEEVSPSLRRGRRRQPRFLALILVVVLAAAGVLVYLSTGGFTHPLMLFAPPPVPTLSVNPSATPSPSPVVGTRKVPEATPTATPTTIPTPTPLSFIQLSDDRQLISPANLQKVRPLGIIGDGAFFSPKSLLAKRRVEKVVVWDTIQNVELRSFTVPASVNDFGFSPDGTLLAASTDDLKIYVWTVSEGSLLQTLEYPQENQATIYENNPSSREYDRTVNLTFSPDGKYLLGRAVGLLAYWRLEDGQRMAFITARPEKVEEMWKGQQEAGPQAYEFTPLHSAVFSPDSTKLAISGYGGTLVFDVASGKLLVNQVDSVYGSSFTQFTPDSRMVLLAGAGYVKLLDAENGKLLHTFNGIQNGAPPVPAWFAFAPDGRSIYVEEDGECCSLLVFNQYDLKTYKLISTGPPAEAHHDLRFSPDGKITISGNVLFAGKNNQLTLPNGVGLYFTPDGRALLARVDEVTVVFGVSKSAPQVKLPPKPVKLGGTNEFGAPYIVGEITELNGTAILFAQRGLSKYNPKSWTLETVKEMVDYQANFGLAPVGRYVFFFTIDQQNKWSLWKSNGTAGGTASFWSNEKLGVEPPLVFGPGVKSTFSVVLGNNMLFFARKADAPTYTLWKTSGTPGGTQQIADLFLDFAPSQPPMYLTVSGKMLFFALQDREHGTELWVSDGTKSGTRMVKDIAQNGETMPRNLVDWNGTLYFVATGDNLHTALWKSDGSEAGTLQISEFTAAGDIYDAEQLTVSGDFLYMVLRKPGTTEIWKSDGSPEGTTRLWQMAKELQPPFPALTGAGGMLFFATPELWKTDGTEAGTVQVGSVKVELSPVALLPPLVTRLMVSIQGVVYFGGNDGEHGDELWQSDGTVGGTRMISELVPGTSGGSPDALTTAAGALFFVDNAGSFYVYQP